MDPVTHPRRVVWAFCGFIRNAKIPDESATPSKSAPSWLRCRLPPVDDVHAKRGLVRLVKEWKQNSKFCRRVKTRREVNVARIPRSATNFPHPRADGLGLSGTREGLSAFDGSRTLCETTETIWDGPMSTGGFDRILRKDDPALCVEPQTNTPRPVHTGTGGQVQFQWLVSRHARHVIQGRSGDVDGMPRPQSLKGVVSSSSGRR